MIRYHTNWMGPVNGDWIKKNGDHWAGGRIDVRGTDDPYGDEIGLPIMNSEDWYNFSEWLKTFETEEIWTLEEIVKMYERVNPEIRWWKEK